MSEEQKQKLSEIRKTLLANGLEVWNKGKPMSAELRSKLEAAGFWEVTDEKRRHLSEAHMGQAAWNKGVPMREETRQKLSETAKANFNPEHQAYITEKAREANTGKERSAATKAKISEGIRNSESHKAFADSRRGIARPEISQKVSEALQTSEKAKAYHEGRIGKMRGNNPSGHYGVIWDKGRNKWQVRIQGKLYGRFERLEDAVAKVQTIMNPLAA